MIPFPDKIRVFDVESVGLHGEGFAVGYVDLDTNTGELDVANSRLYACLPDMAAINRKMSAVAVMGDRAWVRENIPALTPTHDTPYGVRRAFYEDLALLRTCDDGTRWLAADVPWPVEARFLNLVMDENMRKFSDSPYPLLDIASMRAARGWDPLAVVPRLPDEHPIHNPLADARQSARLLWEVIQDMKAKEPNE